MNKTQKRKKLKLRKEWKIVFSLIVIVTIIASFKIAFDNFNANAKRCDEIKGYKCSYKEVEDMIRFGE